MQYPSLAPTITPIPPAFQPSPTRNTVLQWRIYTPTPAPSASPAGIIVIYGGQFKGGSPFDGGPNNAAKDLAAAGYYVASVVYDLAPCGVVPGQVCHDTSTAGKKSGRPPQQSDDIKAYVRALRADNHTNHKVGVLGGSAGGTHAIWVALDTNSSGSDWPNWTADDRPDCAVSLSGAYDLSDRTTEAYTPDPLPAFISDVENYTATRDLGQQKGVSPVSLVTTPTDDIPFKPIFLVNAEEDIMPYHQIVDMICALQSKGVPETDYRTLTLSGSSEHSFAYWDGLGYDPVSGLSLPQGS